MICCRTKECGKDLALLSPSEVKVEHYSIFDWNQISYAKNSNMRLKHLHIKFDKVHPKLEIWIYHILYYMLSSM